MTTNTLINQQISERAVEPLLIPPEGETEIIDPIIVHQYFGALADLLSLFLLAHEDQSQSEI